MKKFLSIVLALCMAFGLIPGIGGVSAMAQINMEKELKLWYDEPAPDDDKGSTLNYQAENAIANGYVGWEKYALPIGNGYMGAMIFGQVEHERVQLTENSLVTPTDGLSNFAETYIDFDHKFENVTEYRRELDLRSATAKVSYKLNNVTYEREYITSYPDKILAIKLTATEKGKLNFTLRPTIPYIMQNPDSSKKLARSGAVVASGDTITLKGTMDDYGVDYEGIYKVVNVGGSITAKNNAEGTDEGTIEVKGADSAVIYVAVGTNYPIGDPKVFDNSRREAGAATAKAYMDTMPDPHEKVAGRLNPAVEKGYEAIKASHLEDYKKYFDRVKLDLGGAVPTIPTDELVADYKSAYNSNGTGGYNQYLEELMFHFGRYLLISSSRVGALPANLQGVWNRYRDGICAVGYWHNVNLQMNYWPSFVTNLPEMFESYIDFYESYLPEVQKDAAGLVKVLNPDNYAEDSNGEKGLNGWNICTGIEPFYAYAKTGEEDVDGAGTGAWTAEMFWDYYDFTGDKELLKNVVYPAIYGSANYVSRVVKDFDGKYLYEKSGSPEQLVRQWTNREIIPKGSAFDQQTAHDIICYTLKAAEILGYKIEDDENLKRMANIVDKLDPVVIGASGQIKEFREEKEYAEFSQANHRHISHLVGLFPGNTINKDTPAWLDAAQNSLELRGDVSEGWAWGMAHRALAWARTGNGKRAYDLLQRQLDTRTWTNLFAAQVAFQIEGNFGATSAIAEMLLQSNNEYIEPLAAIPDAWNTGAYEGLVARGGFEVDVKWENSVLKEMHLLSNQGNAAKIYYPGIKTAKVLDSDGNTVTKSVDDNGILSFNTQKGKKYTITGFSAVDQTLAPTNLTASQTPVVSLNWTASEDAATYNVYQAEGSDSDYTLIKKGINTTSYTFENKREARERYTYAVTAVDKDGNESDTCCAFAGELPPINSASGEFPNDETLKITLNLNYPADSYNVYSVACDGTQTLIKSATSAEDLRVSTYLFAGLEYIVRAVENGTETETVDVVLKNGMVNAMLGKVPTQLNENKWPINSNRPLKGITDGDLSMRYVVVQQDSYTAEENPLVLKFDLEGSYKLNVFTAVEYMGAETGQSTIKIEGSMDGEKWDVLLDTTNLSRKADIAGSGERPSTNKFVLGGAVAAYLKVTLGGTLKQTIGEVVKYMPPAMYEMMCTGRKLSTSFKNNMDGSVWDFSETADVSSYGLVSTNSSSSDTSAVTLENSGVTGLSGDKCLKIYRMANGTNKNISFLDHTTSPTQAKAVKIKFSFNMPNNTNSYLRLIFRGNNTDYEVVQYNGGNIKLLTPTANISNTDKVETVCGFDKDTWYDNEIIVDVTKNYLHYRIKKHSDPESEWKEYDALSTRLNDFTYTNRIGIGFGPSSAGNTYMLIDNYSQQIVTDVVPTLSSYNEEFDADTEFTTTTVSAISDATSKVYRKGWYNGGLTNAFAKIENAENNLSVLSVGNTNVSATNTNVEAYKRLYFNKMPADLIYKFKCDIGGPVDKGYKAITLTLGENADASVNASDSTAHYNIVQIHDGKVSLLVDMEESGKLPNDEVIADFGEIEDGKLYPVECYYNQSNHTIAAIITNGKGQQFTKVRTLSLTSGKDFPAIIRMRNRIPANEKSKAYFDNFEMDLINDRTQSFKSSELLSGDTNTSNLDETVLFNYHSYIDPSKLDNAALNVKINGKTAEKGEDYTLVVDGKKLLVKFKELPVNAECSLDINSVKGIFDGTQTTKNDISFKTSPFVATATTPLHENNILKAKVNSFLTTGTPIVLIAAVYSADGKTLEAVKSTSVFAKSRDAEITVDLSGINTNGKVIKGYVWDSLKTLKPINIVNSAS